MTTYEDQIETRRTSVGAKMMIFALAIFAVLGAFWTIVWFIRSYVEQPRITAATPMALAARDSRPAAPPAADPPAPVATADTSATAEPAQATATPMVARTPQPAVSPFAAPAAQPAAQPAPVAATPPAPDRSAPPGAVADRWLPPAQQASTTEAAPVQAFAPVRMSVAPAAAPTAATTEQPAEAQSDDAAANEVVAVMEPAITGPVPTPRRKPPVGASAKLREPPVPRPRPDGSAPQSVWTAVPVQDDRFPQPSQ